MQIFGKTENCTPRRQPCWGWSSEDGRLGGTQTGEMMSDRKQGRGTPQEPKAACSKGIEGTAEEGLMWEDAVPGRPGQCVHVDRAVGTFRGLQKL